MQEWGLPAKSSGLIATIIVVVVVTYLSIVVGELVPKRLGQLNAERIACLVARPMHWLATLTRPFVWLLSASTNASLRLLRVNQNGSANVTEEEIHAMLVEGSEAGVIEDHEHTMLRNVFRLDERSLSSLMVPRSDIRYLDLAQPLETNLQRLVEYRHSYFPVCDGNLSELVGIINVSKVLHAYIKGEPIDLAALTQEGSLLPETLNGVELLNHFRTHSEQMALVVDEYGELQGLVTQQDLLEALAGGFPAGGWRGQLGIPARRRQLAARWPDPAAGVEGLSGVGSSARRRKTSLSHPRRAYHAAPWSCSTNRRPGDTGTVANWKLLTWMACASTRCSPCP